MLYKINYTASSYTSLLLTENSKTQLVLDTKTYVSRLYRVSEFSTEIKNFIQNKNQI